MQKATHKDHGLSKNEIEIIFNALTPYFYAIKSVGIFGSRACGKFHSYSDIDLVLYGDLRKEEISRMNTLLDESYLGLNVDLLAYQHITYAPLKRRVDNTVKQLLNP